LIKLLFFSQFNFYCVLVTNIVDMSSVDTNNLAPSSSIPEDGLAQLSNLK